jgi:hypothetical protein
MRFDALWRRVCVRRRLDGFCFWGHRSMSALAALAVFAVVFVGSLAGSATRTAQAFPLVYGSCTFGPGVTWGTSMSSSFSSNQRGEGNFNGPLQPTHIVTSSLTIPVAGPRTLSWAPGRAR